MIPRPQILVLAVLAGTVPALAKGPGYLAMVGPAPMRFAKRFDLVVAEPLPAPAPEKTPEHKIGSKDDDKITDPKPPVRTTVETEIKPPIPPPPLIPPRDQSDVSPYQVLQYLLKPASTNAVQPVVVLPPINFTPPPQVVTPPSSTATYQKGP